MPKIKTSTDLRNDYYKKMNTRFELYSLLEQGIRDVKNGDEVPFEDGMRMLRNKRKR